MADASFLDWPFLDPSHRALRARFDAWAAAQAEALIDHHDADASCRRLVAAMGGAGLLDAVVPHEHGGLHRGLDVRSLCIARETLAYHAGLADFAFAMQGLGTGALSLFGSAEQTARYLPPVREGRRIAAFALSEAEAGSDVAAMTTSATPDGPDHVRLDGEKLWISNGGIADHYVVFVRSGEGPGTRGLSAFMVDADAPGLHIAERIDVIAPHPLARIRFEACRVPLSRRIGKGGDGFKIAMATLDVFRSTVGAAALGMARRALDEATGRALSRRMFGATLGDLQLTQAALADSATEIDAAALLIYRAAWAKDRGAARITREAAMAKMFATEAAQRVIDRAIQVFGGEGVRVGSKVEELYREVRALRIYEGATEVQKVIIARAVLGDHPAAGAA
jgi:acyl-CoA dehydrogenase